MTALDPYYTGPAEDEAEYEDSRYEEPDAEAEATTEAYMRSLGAGWDS